jgi:WD40 repeat protein
MWDLKDLSEKVSIQANSPLNAIRFLKERSLVVSGNESGYVELHDLRNETMVVSVEMSSDPVRSLDVTPDGVRVLAAGHDGKIVCYSYVDGGLVNVWATQPSEEVQTRIVAAPDGRGFAVCGAGGVVRLGKVETGEITKVVAIGESWNWVWDAAFTSDSERLAVAGSDGVCRLINCRTGTVMRTFPPLEKCVNCIAILTV